MVCPQSCWNQDTLDEPKDAFDWPEPHPFFLITPIKISILPGGPAMT
jgi:hypothetical protein